jgi:hypothetical protein
LPYSPKLVEVKFYANSTNFTCLFSEVDARSSREKRAAQLVRMSNMCTLEGLASMDLRDFESIPIFFTEEEIEELQAAIDERKSRRLALDEERSLKPVERSDYSPNVLDQRPR